MSGFQGFLAAYSVGASIAKCPLGRVVVVSGYNMMDAPERLPMNGNEQSGTGSNDGPRIIASSELFQGEREIWIAHGKEMYRLRITTSGKLYLTK